MSKPTFKNKKPMQLDDSEEELNDIEPLDTFEQFCSNLQNPYQQNKLIEGSFLQDSFEEENTVKKQDICNQLSVSNSENEVERLSCRSLRLSSPQHEQNFSDHTDESIKFIQFEEFQQGKSLNKALSQSDSIKSQERSRQQLKDISQSNFDYLREPPAPANRNTTVRFKFPSKPYQFKKHLQIEIPEMEESSYEQTLVKEQVNPSDSNPDDYKVKLEAMQQELKSVIAHNKQEKENLYDHIMSVKQDNESLKSEIMNFKPIIEVKDLKIEALLKLNKQLLAEILIAKGKQINGEDKLKISSNEKMEIPVSQIQTPTDDNQKIQYLVGKLHKKSNENSSLQYQISILKNKIEEIQNYYYLENRRELSIQPFETEYQSPLPKEVPSVSLGFQKVSPDVCNGLKQNLSFSSINKDDRLKLKSKQEICSSEQLLNKIKKKHQTEGLNQCSSQIQTYIKSIKMMDQPDQKAKLLFFRKRKQEKVFSIQTSPQIQKLLTEKPLQSDYTKSNTNSQLKSNFFYQLSALSQQSIYDTNLQKPLYDISRKTSDGKQEDMLKLSTPNLTVSQFSNQMLQKQNLNCVRDLLEPTRKLSQVGRKALQNKQERSILQQPINTQFSRSSCDYISENANNHQRNVSQAQETKPHFMTIFEF